MRRGRFFLTHRCTNATYETHARSRVSALVRDIRRNFILVSTIFIRLVEREILLWTGGVGDDEKEMMSRFAIQHSGIIAAKKLRAPNRCPRRRRRRRRLVFLPFPVPIRPRVAYRGPNAFSIIHEFEKKKCISLYSTDIEFKANAEKSKEIYFFLEFLCLFSRTLKMVGSIILVGPSFQRLAEMLSNGLTVVDKRCGATR